MAHLHHPVHAAESVDPIETARNARNGLILFAVYWCFYTVFVFMNAFAPNLMEAVVFAGINLAVLYGLALIASAFVLALAYAWLCRRRRPGAGS